MGSLTYVLLLVGIIANAFAQDTLDDMLATAEGRFQLFQRLKDASGATQRSPTMEDFEVDPTNYLKYKNGQNRRPTDPATEQEISSALQLLFGPNGTISSLEEADTLSENTNGWNAINSALAPRYRIYPEAVNQVNKINNNNDLDEAAFVKKVNDTDCNLDAAHEWLHLNDTFRESYTMFSIGSVTTHVVDKEAAIKVDDDIDAGIAPSFRKHISVLFSGGIADFDCVTGTIYSANVIVDIDVTDVLQPRADPRFLETYTEYRGNINDPTHAPIAELDQGYLVATAMALYGTDIDGNPRRYIPICNGNPINAECRILNSGTAVKQFVRPYEWHSGENATVYGATQDETVVSVTVQEYSPAIEAFDGHQYTGGVIFGQPPLTLLITPDGRKDSLNQLKGSEAIALAWFGRGLIFSEDDTWALLAAFDIADPISGNTNFTAIAEIVSKAIQEAWKDDEIHGTQPGVLSTRSSDNVKIPALILAHPRNTPEYINHATVQPVEESLNRSRDIRDNPPHSRPLLKEDGTADIPPSGKHFESIALDGPSFELDGYSVTWNVGIIWRFTIGFDRDAGITLYNLRLQMPPTAETPEGEMIPYLWRLSVPNFGTTYANSGAGNLYSSSYLESHYTAIRDLVPEANCKGSYITLPLYLASRTSKVDLSRFSYTTYGTDGYTDPFAEALTGDELPFNAFPMEQKNFGVLNHGICIQEHDEENSLWHLYSAQRLRSLSVFSATISESYNVVNTFKLFSDAKIKVIEKLHGKPSIQNHGIPNVGGAYASGGRGGFAANHLHWHVVAMEPHIKKNIEGVSNNVKVADMILGGMDEDSLNWYGTAQHKRVTPITNTSNTALNRFDFNTQRAWIMGAQNSDGEDLGGLRIMSRAWGPPLTKDDLEDVGRYSELTDLYKNDTILNHWWLRDDIHVGNSDWTRAAQVLLSESNDTSCQIRTVRYGSTHRCMPEEQVGDSPVVYAVMKKYHQVITEEMPVQAGFTMVELEMWPHNLLKFNPNILSRYDPRYNAFFQNPLDGPQIYTPPYESEWNTGDTDHDEL